VEDVVDVIDFPRQPDVLGLDGDAALTFDVHSVQVLRAHRAFVDDTGELQHSIGQRRLAVIDVGDDGEVPNLRRRGEGLVGEATDGNLLVQVRMVAPQGGPSCVSSVSRQGRLDTIASTGSSPVAALLPAGRSPMLENMASPWKTFQRLIDVTENLVFNEAPKLIRTIQKSETLQRGIQQGIKIGIDAIAGAPNDEAPAITAGRPVTNNSVPTAQRARKLVYAPDLDGRADPGEIVWTWVVYEDDPTRGKDRPVLVVGRDRRTLLGLMLSSQEHHRNDPDWIGIGSGGWDYEGRASWVRLDRVLDVPEEGIRREGAILERQVFEIVAARLRAEYSWS
jgi:hypothetical protein